jgi:hypothetical protein
MPSLTARSLVSAVLAPLSAVLLLFAGVIPATASADVTQLPLSSSTFVHEGDRVIVEAHFEAGAIAALEAVKAEGAKVLTASRRYQTLSLSIEPADYPALAATPGVDAVTPVYAPRTDADDDANNGASTGASPTLCEGGSVISEALEQMRVAEARAAFGARGAGMTIGVISDSFDQATEDDQGLGPVATHAHDDEVSGDLPGPSLACDGQQTPVNVLVESPADAEPKPADEGRAMLQVIHDLAPHAKLAFASDFGGEMAFAQDIEHLAAPVSAGGGGADVIVDDLGLASEPFFQEGPAEAAIRRVREKGVLYFTSAGNENRTNAAGEEIASWEAPRFRDVGVADDPEACGTAAIAALNEGEGEGLPGAYEPDCMDFDPGPAVDTQFGITVEPGAALRINLQWAEPWYGVETDLIALLVTGPEGGPGEEVLTGGGSFDLPAHPQDLLAWVNETGATVETRLVIARCAGPSCNPDASASADPRLKFTIEAGNGPADIEYPSGRTAGTEDTAGPTIVGHASSPYAMTVASIFYTEPADAPLVPEDHSSRGPAAFYFAPVDGNLPAAPLPTPEILAKPDFTATNCASTTFFAQVFADGAWHFCGTSEAAPQAAAVAALMEQATPLATPAQIIAAMKSSATPFTLDNRPSAVGAGLVDARKAMEAVGAQPVDDPPSAVIAPPKPEEKAPSPSPTAAPAPVVTITRGPAALSNVIQPVFEFTSDRPVSFTCQVDGGAPLPCASPFAVPTRLADGGHGFVVTGKGADGRSGTSSVYSFAVDTKAPRARILAHPRKLVKTRKRTVVVRFRLGAGKERVGFLCQFDGEATRPCPANLRHRFGKGAHTVRVRAKDGLGNVSARPTVFHFRVRVESRRG